MSSVDKAIETQKQNIQAKTGRSLKDLMGWIQKSGSKKHKEIIEAVMQEFSLGWGDANLLASLFLNPPGSQIASIEEITDGYYAGKSEVQRQIHDKAMKMINKLGEFEIAPKKTYLSFRRKRQFAMLGPASKGRVELGLNMKDISGTDRLLEQPAGGMCQYKVFMEDPSEVDDELMGWVKKAYDAST